MWSPKSCSTLWWEIFGRNWCIFSCTCALQFYSTPPFSVDFRERQSRQYTRVAIYVYVREGLGDWSYICKNYSNVVYKATKDPWDRIVRQEESKTLTEWYVTEAGENGFDTMLGTEILETVLSSEWRGSTKPGTAASEWSCLLCTAFS